MADRKLSASNALTSLANGDLVSIVDVSDNTDGAGGTTKKITKANFVADFVATANFIGIIVMWSGLVADVPVGWAFCDGTLNAPGPDLRDKFIVGAKQDSGGVAKSNIEGALSQTGGVTGHSHSGHANLTHAGGAVGDHTGLTHSLAIADHPDLTHAALSHAASTFSHADHSVASASHTHAAVTLTHADHSVASASHAHGSTVVTLADHSLASFTGFGTTQSHASIDLANDGSLTLSISSQGTARTVMTRGTSVVGATTFNLASRSHSHAASTLAHTDPTLASFSGTQAAITLTHPDHSVDSFTGSAAATTLTHDDHSFPSLSHQAIGTHKATDYGVHTITQPADHGTAGTLTHAFTQPNVHTISAHDTVLSIPNYFALAFIQRMA